jgi:hypothetical protein
VEFGRDLDMQTEEEVNVKMETDIGSEEERCEGVKVEERLYSDEEDVNIKEEDIDIKEEEIDIKEEDIDITDDEIEIKEEDIDINGEVSIEVHVMLCGVNDEPS